MPAPTMKPLNYTHRIVLVMNLTHGRSCTMFVESEDVGRTICAGIQVGATVATNGPEERQTIIALVCPEDMIAMRDKGEAPGPLRDPGPILEFAERVLEKLVPAGRSIMTELSPS